MSPNEKWRGPATLTHADPASEPADTFGERRLERLTSPEISAALASGRRTVVLACGAIEQHGPHLPLSVDSDHAEVLALSIARRLDALVAPTLRIGCSDHHMAFAGSLSVRPETLEAMYVDCCVSLARHGFERVLVFSGHIGNFHVLSDMAPRLNAAVPPGVEVHVFSDRDALLSCWRDVVEEKAGMGDRVGGHADIAETSIMLAMNPTAVRMNSFEAGYRGDTDAATLEQLLTHGVAVLSANGVLGDPAGASALLGRHCLDAETELLVHYFQGDIDA